ncbi:aminoglycoside phosphotransferase family protein [Planomonospora sp. ID67723]|uniref:phosphotransferase family protein n=1 Tax=Planomonospora sp. ID67723 TaxID=2738134 RepID=UPI0018C3B638|nr:aminoglycoside phosphotransferase family protein [Planomonospora sp. ID67723]MBG0831558.1 aminoglycoside phosphotransferase family protein [Planomonospora sp. ID67723]
MAPPAPPPDAIPLDTVRRTFTALTGEHADDVAALPPGYGHLSWQVATGTGRYLIKTAIRNAGVTALFRQVTAQQAAATGGVSTPLVVAASATGGPLKRPCYVQTWIDGIDAATALQQTPVDAAALGSAFGRTVAGLHRIRGPRVADDCAATTSYPTWRHACTARLDRMIRSNREAAVLSEEILRPVADRLTAMIGALPDDIGPRLIHRDLYLPNVLLTGPVGDTPQVALLDWESAAFGDPVWDFVKLTMWVFDRHPLLHLPFLEGYTATAPLPGDFERRLLTYQGIEYLAAFPYFGRRWPDAAMLEGFRKLLAAWMDSAGLDGARP